MKGLERGGPVVLGISFHSAGAGLAQAVQRECGGLARLDHQTQQGRARAAAAAHAVQQNFLAL